MMIANVFKFTCCDYDSDVIMIAHASYKISPDKDYLLVVLQNPNASE